MTRLYSADPPPSALELDNQYGPDAGPQSGIYIPVPVMTDTPYAIDIRNQGASGWQMVKIEIAVDVTSVQSADPLLTDGIYYCFTKTATTALIGLSHLQDYKFDMVRACPAIIGVGKSVQEVCPAKNPYLQLLSRNARAAEVRIRVV
jgi:hypothetical protein